MKYNHELRLKTLEVILNKDRKGVEAVIKEAENIFKYLSNYKQPIGTNSKAH
jgi:hypothetical protein